LIAQPLQAKRLWQGLAAVTALGLMTVWFDEAPLHDSINWQMSTLSYLHGGRFRQTIDTPPVARADGLPARFNEPLEPAIRANISSGFYDRPLSVSLTASKPGPIYYSLDGNRSFREPLRYTGPIAIDRTTVLSFASEPSKLATGPVETHTYLMGEMGRLPVLSLALNPAFLWNRYAGIYRNFNGHGRAWQRPAQVEYFEDKNSSPIRFPAEVKIHGGWSRNSQKKSFQLSYALARVSGADRQSLLVWPGDDRPNRAVVVRAAAMDVSYRLGYELFRSVYGDAGGVLPRATPVQLLLNGAAWGLYNLHEKIDPMFLARIHGAGEYDLVDDADYRRTPQADAWNSLLDFFRSRDLSEEQNFEQAAKLVDLGNLTDYWLFNIYAANLDWPQNNYYAFRKRAPGERWHWVSWDSDATFNGTGVHHDTLAWATRAVLRHDLSYAGKQYDDERWLVSTAIIRGLLRNPTYRARFVNRFCELHRDFFQPERLEARFERILNQITPHFGVDWERWPGSKSAYLAAVQGVRRFIMERPAFVLEQFRRQFEFSACPGN
jgi:hypothetical protein